MRLMDVPPFDGEHVNVIIETPKGRRNKFSYDETLDLFRLGGPLPAGAVFPFDFGFVPGTRGDDGDPIDVLVVMEEPAHVGCLVEARLVGVIEARQTERDGTVERNDRIVAVAAKSREYGGISALEDLPATLVGEIEHFFVSYNQVKGKKFEVLGRFGPDRARAAITAGLLEKKGT
ncbi:MAG TPA: inorganic diphosphatase [Vicinamibacterales bacterium]|nr:inorganic diphosphatase [Vicinamibacterales bacterium]